MMLWCFVGRQRGILTQYFGVGVSQLLGLPIFTMHSLRHGRATLGFLNGDLPEVIRLEGRWAAKKSMELYLQAATSLLMALKAPLELDFLLAEGPFIRGAILRFV